MLPIYCDHFGLTREPFNVTPDPSFLFRTDSHEEALAQLVYGIKARRGFIVLTGEVGTGKTTLIRCLLDELNGGTKAALIFHTIVSPKDLLRYICEKFGLVTPQENEREFHDYIGLLERFLIASVKHGENAALIIDEAQNLTTEVLENIRLLSNFENSEQKLLQIVLVGQPELSERLNAPELRQIKQRVALRHHLRSLTFAECQNYVGSRLKIAGCRRSLFTADAIAAVHNCSAGLPRLINVLCDNGLLAAYALGKETIDMEIIEEIARDLQIGDPSGFKAGVALSAKTTPSRSPMRRGAGNSRVDDKTLVVPQRDGVGQQHGEMIRASDPALDPYKRDNGQSNGTPAISFQSDNGSRTANGLETETVPVAFFGDMQAALTEALGPMAKIVLYDQIAAMGKTFDEFPKARLAELVEKTSEEILTDDMKAKFRLLIADEMSRMTGSNDTYEAATASRFKRPVYRYVRRQ